MAGDDPEYHHQQIAELERELLALVRFKGPSDPRIRCLRTAVRDGYEALIVRDHGSSQSLEMEQALWRLHYRGIEEFRARIRRLSGVAAAPPAAKRRKKGNRQEPLVRVMTAFKAFLGEASGFFHGLMIKLRLKYGLPSSFLKVDALVGEQIRDDARACHTSCHRLLIYLGDLARYKELYVTLGGKSRDWTLAANYYRQAALLCPSNGNPYNQLAVLATYSENELLALYYYCRSVAVESPFSTARDNLALLFEKNQQRMAQAAYFPSESELPVNASKMKGAMQLLENVLQSGQLEVEHFGEPLHIEECHNCFTMYFTRLIGILFMQSGVEELQEVLIFTERLLKHLTHARLAMLLKLNSFCKHEDGITGIPLALEVIVIIIFSIYHLSSKAECFDSSLQKSPGSLLISAMKFGLEFTCLLIQEGAKFSEAEVNPVLPCVVIFMEWLVGYPDMLEVCSGWLRDIFLNSLHHIETLESQFLKNELDADGSCTGSDICVIEAATVAQWEDRELLGYIPLAHVHLKLDFSRQVSIVEACDIQTCYLWKHRYVAASRSLRENSTKGECCNSPVLSVRVKVSTSSGKVSMFGKGNQSSNLTDGFLLGGNSMPSLKDWIKGNAVFLPVSSSMHKEELEGRNVGDAALYNIAKPSIAQDLTKEDCDVVMRDCNCDARSLPSKNTFAVSQSTDMVLPKFKIPSVPSFLQEPSLSSTSKIQCSPSEQKSEFLTHQVRVGKPISSLGFVGVVGTSVEEAGLSNKNDKVKGLIFSKSLKENSPVSPVLEEKSMEDSRWLDCYTHVKPVHFNKAAVKALRSNYLQLSSGKCYESQNPFLLWMQNSQNI